MMFRHSQTSLIEFYSNEKQVTDKTPPTFLAHAANDSVVPPANGSDTINDDPGSVTWARTTDAGNPGNASMFLNAFEYMDAGQTDIYRTPKIDVSTLDSVVLYFSVAYKVFDGAADSLKISASLPHTFFACI